MSRLEMQRPPRPESAPLRALYGKISAPIVIDNTQVYLVQEGAGMTGLEKPPDNRDWGGLTGHSFFAAGLSMHIANLLKEQGFNVNPHKILNAHLASHTGRRTHDEAKKYPQYIPDAAEKVKFTNEELGVRHVKKIGLKKEFVDIIEGLAHGHKASKKIRQSLDYRIASYADHRCEHEIYPLSERLGTFLKSYFFSDKDIKPEAAKELEERIYTSFDRLVQLGRKGELTLEHAVSVARTLGAAEISARGLSLSDFMQLLVEDADLEKTMVEAGINPDAINNKNYKTPRWERYLRRLYIGDAISESYELINQARTQPANKRNQQEAQTLGGWDSWAGAVRKIVRESIPQANWPSQGWAPALLEEQYLASLAKGDHEPPKSKSKNTTPRPLEGWARAVWFFQYLDLTPKEKVGYRKLLKASK